jgi:pyruvate/2-oxoglutarate dehydrogenase complex dihydrolipoamide dehydrogenase (E3) component
LACGHVLIAAGRHPVNAGLNLVDVGVPTGDRSEIVTDARRRTSNPRVWAPGDRSHARGADLRPLLAGMA